MITAIKNRLWKKLTHWLTKEPEYASPTADLYNFDRLCYEIRPGDILLVEGRTRVSNVIKMITQSPWTHAMIYIGRLYDITDENVRNQVRSTYNFGPEQQLVVEALLGHGTIITPLLDYAHEHLRICRAKGMSPSDSQKVISYTINHLGSDYDVRQLLDLARFMFPYGILPRRWRSSLFTHNVGGPTRTVCSTMLAEAFDSIKFPILPFTEKTQDGRIRLLQKNPRLFTPKDFDYSPYFEIIKYPYFDLDDLSLYKHLPWSKEPIYCNSIDDCYNLIPKSPETTTEIVINSAKQQKNGPSL